MMVSYLAASSHDMIPDAMFLLFPPLATSCLTPAYTLHLGFNVFFLLLESKPGSIVPNDVFKSIPVLVHGLLLRGLAWT